MDPSAGDAASPPPHRGATGESGNLAVLLRLFLALLFPVVFFFSSSFVIGVVALLVSNFSIPSPMSLPAQCKIVSSSVDISVKHIGTKSHSATINSADNTDAGRERTMKRKSYTEQQSEAKNTWEKQKRESNNELMINGEELVMKADMDCYQ